MNSGKLILHTLIALAFHSSPSFAAGESAQSFTLDGQLYGDAAATTPLADTGTFIIQILDPSQTCVLYAEAQTFDTRASGGAFLASVGSALGAPKRAFTGSLDVGNGMGLVYSNVNATGIPGQLTGGGACLYVPQPGDVRFVRTTVRTDADGQTRTLSPDLKLEAAASAVTSERAETLRGLAPTSFLRLATAGNPDLTQTNLETVFANFASLQNLLAGLSASYMQSGPTTAVLPRPATPPTNATAAANEGRVWYDAAAHAIRYSDGTVITQAVGLNASAQTALGAGTAAAPTYSFGASPATGVFSPGANQLAFATNGAAALNILANGNVGIGTATPLAGARLHVAGGPIYGGQGVISNEQYGFGDNTTYFDGVTSGTSSALTTTVNGAPVMRLQADGKVGIGTAAPASTLDVNGFVSTQGLSSNGTLSAHHYTTGVYAPSGALPGAFGIAVNNVAATNGSTELLGFSARGAGNVDQYSYVGSVSSASGYTPATVIGQQTGATTYAERLRITPTGAVGIGTDQPTSKFFVYDNVDAAETRIDVKNASTVGTTATLGATSGAYFNEFRAFSAGASQIQSNAPAMELVALAGYLRFGTNGTERVRIDQTGRVGIGTSTPSQRLDVAGTVNATAFTINGTPVGTSTSSYWNQSGQDLNYTLGRIGVGTSAPTGILHVEGGTAASGAGSNITLRAQGGASNQNGGNVILMGGAGGGTGAQGYVSVGNAAPSLAPAGGLYVENGLFANGIVTLLSNWIAFGDSKVQINGNSNYNTLTFSTNLTERMRISPAGNVGVGTANPTTLLQVAGVISPAADNTYALGSASLRFTNLYAASGVINTSDARLKKDVRDADLGLGFVDRLRPVSYRWIDGDDVHRHYGLIAQETARALGPDSPDQTSGIVVYDGEHDRYGLRYTELIAPLIKAIQELHAGLVTADERVRRLSEENARLRERLDRDEATTRDTRAALTALTRRLDHLPRGGQ